MANSLMLLTHSRHYRSIVEHSSLLGSELYLGLFDLLFAPLPTALWTAHVHKHARQWLSVPTMPISINTAKVGPYAKALDMFVVQQP